MFSSSKIKKHKVHFLHIGKTGGTAIKSVLSNAIETPYYTLKLHGHDVGIKDIPKGESIIFFLRDPIARFISGFYSRQRKGQPRYFSEWSPLEREAFGLFDTPNQLACSLSNELTPNHHSALKAMNNIQHLKSYKNWYKDLGYFQYRIEDILYIGFQESLNANYCELKTIIGLTESAKLPDDDIEAHRNPKGLDMSIHGDGVIALNKWYAEDIEFLSLCKKIMSNRKLHSIGKSAMLHY